MVAGGTRLLGPGPERPRQLKKCSRNERRLGGCRQVSLWISPDGITRSWSSPSHPSLRSNGLPFLGHKTAVFKFVSPVRPPRHTGSRWDFRGDDGEGGEGAEDPGGLGLRGEASLGLMSTINSRKWTPSYQAVGAGKEGVRAQRGANREADGTFCPQPPSPPGDASFPPTRGPSAVSP